MTVATLDDIRGLGYDVDVSFEGDGFTVYRVNNHGISGLVRDDDQAAIDSLADRAAHDERVRQQGETDEQRTRRWVREKRIPPPNVRDVT